MIRRAGMGVIIAMAVTIGVTGCVTRTPADTLRISLTPGPLPPPIAWPRRRPDVVVEYSRDLGFNVIEDCAIPSSYEIA